MRFDSFSRYITPVVSLAGGLATVLLLRRGIGFAPFSLGIAVVAWVAAVLFSRFFDESAPQEVGPPSRARRALRWLSKSVVAGLYQNVLFFLVPIWFGSAELTSVNVVFPVLLSALALVACFDDHFVKRVLEHPIRRTVASAILLFSVSVPAVALENRLPLRLGVGLSAAVTTLVAAALAFGRRGVLKTLTTGLMMAAVAGAVLYLIAVWLPPVPVQCVTGVAAAGIEARRPVGIAEAFPAGTPRIHVHFSVAAPEGFRQEIRFQWYVDGQKRGRPIPSSIVGGRKRGFRTWTYLSAPKRGAYRVDLETGDGQLIGRVRFRVG